MDSLLLMQLQGGQSVHADSCPTQHEQQHMIVYLMPIIEDKPPNQAMQ